jgi:hypothetical protein
MNKSILAAACLVAMPFAAAAQDISGGITLGYGNTNVQGSSTDLNQLTFDGRVKADLGNGLTLGARGDSVQLSASGTSGSINGTLLGVDGSYKLANGVSFGAYAEQAQLSFSGGGGTLTGNSYGLTAGYASNGLSLDGFVGRTDTNIFGSGVDMTTIGLGAKYQAAPNLTIGGSLARTRLSSGGTNVDLTAIGVAAAYEINQEVGVFGGITQTSLDLASLDLTTFGLGVSYNMAKMTNFPAVASFVLARSTVDLGGGSGHLDTIRLGLTIPLGTAGNKVPMNSVADSIFSPSHSVISSAVLSTF